MPIDVDKITDVLLDAVHVPIDALHKQINDIANTVRKMGDYIDNIPQPVNGKDADPNEVACLVMGQVRSSFQDKFNHLNDKFKSAIEDIDKKIETLQCENKSFISQLVSEHIAALPAPQDGKSVSVDDVVPLIESVVHKAVSALPKAERGEKGIGVAGAFIDRAGSLNVTLSNGEVHNLGLVNGHNGKDGKDGKDGFGFDDLSVKFDNQRTLSLIFSNKGETKSFDMRLPVIIGRGIYAENEEYQKGDAVTYAGSLWIAQVDTHAKPGTNDEWQLAVKRGRDGQNGKMVELPSRVKV